MFLGKREPDRGAVVVLASLLESLGNGGRSAEVGTDGGLELGVAAGNVLTGLNSLLDSTIDALPVGATEEGPGAKEGKRVVLGTSIVDRDVPEHVFVDLLGEVDTDAEEVGISLGGLDFLEKTLEPTEGRSITADPEELDTAERADIAPLLAVPDVLKDRSEWRNTDTSTDQDGDLAVEHILGGSTEGTIDSDGGELRSTSVLELDEVTTDTDGGLVVLLSTLHGSRGHGSNDRGANTETVTKGASPVTDLADVNGNVGVFRGRGDGERMPLEARELRNLEEEPLASSVLEAGLDDAELHSTRGVDENLRQPGGAATSVLTVNALTEVEDTGPDGQPPALVTHAELGVIEGEGVCVSGVDGVTNEASGSMGVETDHEEEGEVVGVPESLEALLTNPLVGGGVHEDHDEEHEVTSDSSGLGVVDLEGKLLTNLSALDIDEVNVMGGSVNHSPESQGVGHLTMEPDVLISREEPLELGPNNTDDVAEHGDEDHATIEGQDETGTTGSPDGVFETVEGSQVVVGLLGVPTPAEEEKVYPVPDDIESKLSGR